MQRRHLRVAIVVAAAIGIVGLALVLESRSESEPGEAMASPDRVEVEETRPVLADVPKTGPVAREPLLPELSAQAKANPPGSPFPTAMAPLRVIVRDPWEQPVRGGSVIAWLSGTAQEPVGQAGITDGLAELRLPLGVAHRIEALPKTLGALELAPASRDPVFSEWGEVTLRVTATSCRIAGRVVAAETGAPLPSAHVSVQTPEFSSSVAGVLSEGKFDLHVPAGPVTLAASAAGRAPETRSFHLSRGEWIRDVEVPLALIVHVSLEGRVVSEEGIPLEGAEVTLAFLGPHKLGRSTAEFMSRLGEMRTDGTGRFRFDSVPIGKSAIDVRKEGYGPTGGVGFWVEGQGEEVEIRLTRAGRLRVRGLASNGAPVTIKKVVLERNGEEVLRAERGSVMRKTRNFSFGGTVTRDGEWGLGERSAVDDQGFLVIEGVPPGEYEVRVTAAGLGGNGVVAVVAGESVEVEVRLTESRG